MVFSFSILDFQLSVNCVNLSVACLSVCLSVCHNICLTVCFKTCLGKVLIEIFINMEIKCLGYVSSCVLSLFLVFLGYHAEREGQLQLSRAVRSAFSIHHSPEYRHPCSKRSIPQMDKFSIYTISSLEFRHLLMSHLSFLRSTTLPAG